MDSVIPSPTSKTAKPVFDWADPFALDGQLSEDDRLVRDYRESLRRRPACPAYRRSRFAKRKPIQPSFGKWESWAY